MTGTQWSAATTRRARERNEDAYATLDTDSGHAPAAVICDGIGGHPYGEVAARAAADAFIETQRMLGTRVPPQMRLHTGVHTANGAIADRIEFEPRLTRDGNHPERRRGDAGRPRLGGDRGLADTYLARSNPEAGAGEHAAPRAERAQRADLGAARQQNRRAGRPEPLHAAAHGKKHRRDDGRRNGGRAAARAVRRRTAAVAAAARTPRS